MGDSPIRGAALLRLWRDQQGLELVSLQGRLGGGGDQGEVGPPGGGLVSRGRPLRRWALAAMVTLESVTPAASLPRVLPVQGQRMSRSSSF